MKVRVVLRMRERKRATQMDGQREETVCVRRNK